MKTEPKVFLLLNGEIPSHLPDLKSYNFICTTDGGLHILEKFGVIPDLLTGDFDSSTNHPKNVEIVHTPDQNYTDFDKMLQILYDRGYNIVDVYGASGGEQDHFLGNLNTALVWKEKLKITFFDNNGYYFFAKNKTELQNVKGKTISLFPFPKAKKVTSKGLQYPLKNTTLKIGKLIGTRNYAIENNVSIRFNKGNLIIFVISN